MHAGRYDIWHQFVIKIVNIISVFMYRFLFCLKKSVWHNMWYDPNQGTSMYMWPGYGDIQLHAVWRQADKQQDKLSDIFPSSISTIYIALSVCLFVCLFVCLSVCST